MWYILCSRKISIPNSLRLLFALRYTLRRHHFFWTTLLPRYLKAITSFFSYIWLKCFTRAYPLTPNFIHRHLYHVCIHIKTYKKDKIWNIKQILIKPINSNMKCKSNYLSRQYQSNFYWRDFALKFSWM